MASPLNKNESVTDKASLGTFVPLYPSLGKPADLPTFTRSGRTVGFALSPRANSLVIFETPKNPTKIERKESRSVLYFAQWASIRLDDVPFYTESYVTFESLQRVSFVQQENEHVSVGSAQNVATCWRMLGVYIDNLQAHIDRLANAEIFEESRYLHFAALSSTVDLFQSVYTSESGNTTTALVGEELLLWLNMNYVAPSNDEGPVLNSYEKPWLADEFWTFILRCILRGLSKTAIYFLERLSNSHPSRSLRRLSTELVPLLQKHPRSSNFDTEQAFLIAHRRWRETMLKNFKRHVDELDEGDGIGEASDEGKWRSAIDIICSILAGDKKTLFQVCQDQEWGWREALGVWGVWIDVRFTREDMPATVIYIIETLPVNPHQPDELIQTALASYDVISAIEGVRKWDTWLAAHLIDMLDKLGELEDQMETDAQDPDSLSMRTSALVAHAMHLHSDPTLWRITLEYLAACGSEGRSMVAEVLRRTPVDIELPSQRRDEKEQSHGLLSPVKLSANGTSSGLGVDGETADTEKGTWAKWEERVLKIINVCTDYGLQDVLLSVCKSISHALMRRGLYGRAVQYSVLAKDARGVSRIADLLLHEYITKGADEFCAQVASIPPDFLPSPTASLSLLHLQGGPNDVFTNRLQFISRYAWFHRLFAEGDRRDALKYLVGMLSGGVVPRYWWGVVLLDAGGMLDDEELFLTTIEAYELLRHLEDIYIHAEQGLGHEYLGALELIMHGEQDPSKDAKVLNGSVGNALQQLQIVRLALARYLARCTVAGHRF